VRRLYAVRRDPSSRALPVPIRSRDSSCRDPPLARETIGVHRAGPLARRARGGRTGGVRGRPCGARVERRPRRWGFSRSVVATAPSRMAPCGGLTTGSIWAPRVPRPSRATSSKGSARSSIGRLGIFVAIERVQGPPDVVTALPDRALTLYEAALTIYLTPDLAGSGPSSSSGSGPSSATRGGSSPTCCRTSQGGAARASAVATSARPGRRPAYPAGCGTTSAARPSGTWSTRGCRSGWPCPSPATARGVSSTATTSSVGLTSRPQPGGWPRPMGTFPGTFGPRRLTGGP